MNMKRLPRHTQDKRRLRLWLAAFFLALIVPAGFLVQYAYSQLKWEAFHRHRLMAEEFASRLDRGLAGLIRTEEARGFAEYGFLVVSGDPAASYLERSNLSAYPVVSRVPGLMGYFQIDSDGGFTSPLLPEDGISPSAYGVSIPEEAERRSLEQRILNILDENRLTKSRSDDKATLELSTSETDEISPAAPVSESETAVGQSAFDRLLESPAEEKAVKQKISTLGRVEDLDLDPSYQSGGGAPLPKLSKKADLSDERGRRKEQSAVYEQTKQVRVQAEEPAVVVAPQPGDGRITMFESEIDAFEFALLDSGHFVLFRRVWRDGQRYIQGALIEPKTFFDGAIASEFRATALSAASNLAVAYSGDVLSAYSGQSSRQYLSRAGELQGTLLYRTNLPAPLSDVELVFSITRLPTGPGGTVVTWAALVLLLVLCVGLFLMYRLGSAQIDLARQQQDFVSAVSHELKTPLTSIRMYSEMLREGWADEAKKKIYYSYIHDESERLSRLISNVLQLARLTRNDLKLDLKPVTAAALMDGVRSKVTSQIEGAGFRLNMTTSHQREAGEAVINVDADAFTQIVINLVDNAIKFSSGAENKTIDIDCDRLSAGTLRLRVRDYGPGVPKDQIKQIFKMFYRVENELNRDTIGTGIGLALVKQLAAAMNGAVDVVNREPGAEFVILFPIVQTVSEV